MNEHEELKRVRELRIDLQKRSNQITKRIEGLEDIEEQLYDKLMKNKLTKISEKDLCYLLMFCQCEFSMTVVNFNDISQELDRRYGGKIGYSHYVLLKKYFDEILNSVEIKGDS